MLPPKDVEFLYKSIENYQQIMTILVLVKPHGSMLRGQMRPWEAYLTLLIASPKPSLLMMTKVAKATYVAAKLWGDCTKEDKEGSSGSSPSNKRKRFVFTQDAMLSSLICIYD